jgi:hypothetical protein
MTLHSQTAIITGSARGLGAVIAETMWREVPGAMALPQLPAGSLSGPLELPGRSFQKFANHFPLEHFIGDRDSE